MYFLRFGGIMPPKIWVLRRTQLSYAAPKLSYAAPKLSYAAPKLSYAAPELSYAAPKLSYADNAPSELRRTD
jgi:hypothetical protein